MSRIGGERREFLDQPDRLLPPPRLASRPLEFKRPEIYDIGFESDHMRFEGSGYVILRDIVVNHRGFTSCVSEPATGNDEVTIRMLRALLEQHYTLLECLAAEIPSPFLDAAHEYVNSVEEDVATEKFFAALSDLAYWAPTLIV